MHIFLYGTLRDAQLLSIVAGLVPSEEVTLWDHWVARQVDAPLPMICARAGMVARGNLQRDVSDEALARLDAYELPFDYMRQEVTVRDARGQEVAAMSYFPSVTIAASQMPWDIDEWRAPSKLDSSLGPISPPTRPTRATSRPRRHKLRFP